MSSRGVVGRSRRRRPWAPVVLALIAVAIVLVVIVGGAAHIGQASGPYRRNIDRSFAAQAGLVVDQSNATGSSLRTLLREMAGMTRAELEADLDQLVMTSATDATEAVAFASPSPSGGVGPGFAQVMADRADEVAALRSLVDGLLGMTPLPMAGTTTIGVSTRIRPITAGQATTELGSVESGLRRGDDSYAALRRDLAAQAGHPDLPRSVWITAGSPWSSGAGALVGALSGSRTLTPDPQVALVTVRLVPAALPSGAATNAPAGVSLLPPTTSLSLAAIVADQGNEYERGVVVSETIQAQPSGATTAHHRTISLTVGGSAVVSLPPLPVRPGHTYALSVTVSPPTAQSGDTGLSETFTVQVAPSTGTTTAVGTPSVTPV